MAGRMGLGSLSIAQPQSQQVNGHTMPGPGDGMNTTGSLYGMTEQESIYMFNLIPSEFGPRTRLGYREHSNTMLGDGVRTVVPFDGADSDHTSDKLFATTNTNIYDCTISGAAVDKFTFADQTSDSGWAHFTHFVNDDGNNLLLMAVDKNGLFEYDPLLDTWVATTGVTFPVGDTNTIADIVFIVSHKQRLWVICNENSHAYYLPVGSKSGALTRFDFGNKFKHGGELVGLYNWSIDGGDGVDDYLMAVSGGGDLIMYQGEDPAASATWRTTGTWYVGEVPSGRRALTEVGGDLWILSTQGLITAQALVAGVYTGDSKQSPAFKISRLIRDRMYTEKNTRGWEVQLNANEAEFVITSPAQVGQPRLQYVYSIVRNAWGIWRDLPAKTFGNWNGRFYIGGEDTILYEMVGDLDNVLLTPINDGTDAKPIEFSILSSYQDFGESATFKRVQYLRPTFLGELTPQYGVKPQYDYETAEPTLTSGQTPEGQAIWDVAAWDNALWGGQLTAFEELEGGGGLGRVVAYAIRGTTQTRITLASVDVMWDSGGFI